MREPEPCGRLQPIAEEPVEADLGEPDEGERQLEFGIDEPGNGEQGERSVVGVDRCSTRPRAGVRPGGRA